MSYADKIGKPTPPPPPPHDKGKESPSGLPWEGYYYSAYGIAVKHGFKGTEEEWLASLIGPQGERGTGIASIEKTGTAGLVDTYTITYENGESSTYEVTNGADGSGIASIEKTGTSGLVDTYTITFDDGDTETFTVTNGKDGIDGQDGQDGAAAGFGTPTASIDANVGTPSVTVTASGPDTEKVFTFDFKNLKGATGATGQDGQDGADGQDGVSPAVTITSITGGHTVTITDKDHPSGQSFNVTDGTNGTDGQDGAPGPNTVTSSTSTDLTGILKGNGSAVSAIANGTTGQVLKMGASGPEWGAAPGGVSPSSATPQMNGVGDAGSSADYARGDHVHPSDTGKLGTSGDGSNVTATFTAASSRTNISTGEKLTVIFGKIAKWFADLGAAAFRGVDSTVTASSTNLVESGAVKSALTQVAENMADAYDSTASYVVGDLCIYNDTLYKCNTAIGTGGEAWTAAHWTATTIKDALPYTQTYTKTINLTGTVTYYDRDISLTNDEISRISNIYAYILDGAARIFNAYWKANNTGVRVVANSSPDVSNVQLYIIITFRGV